jgi:hypothetical protein
MMPSIMQSHGMSLHHSIRLSLTLPSAETQLVAVAIASAIFGYFLATGFQLPYSKSIPEGPSSSTAQASKPEVSAVDPLSITEPTLSIPPQEPSKSNKKKKAKQQQQQALKEEAAKAEAEGEIDAGSDSEDEKAAVTEASLDQVKPGKWEECKLVLVVNQELGMGKGKIAAQCG